MSEQEAGDSPPSLRYLLILEVLAAEARPMTPTEINALLKLPKPTIHRLVRNLEELGWLSRHLDGRSYLPGPRLRQMMQGLMRAASHAMPRREILLRLNALVGETCNLSIPDDGAMLYVDRVETQWPLRIALQVGSRVPLHATSAGKACLGSMAEPLFERYLRSASLKAYTGRTITDPAALREEVARIRAQGHAEDNQEFVDGMIALAVPVKDRQGHLAATVSFHAPMQRMSLEEGRKHLPDLRAAARELAELL